ncbi:MICOS complex subunit MIC60 [Pleurostoma richardsiae]|uniref:MICOS complex subunit MIC60 n=1 Tax=Pleurostoma richardsiae TaxID=41990 RepID=A0AA38RKN7_9PEZI|nr:MICOS complex subunit MIC60 [Pleurostoma richardsiae]
MLRASLQSVRVLGGRPLAAATGRQWQAAALTRAGLAGKRLFADEKKPAIGDPKPAVIPASETITAASSEPPPPATETTIDAKTISPEDVPLTPPSSPESSSSDVAQAAATTPPPPSPPPPAPKKGFVRRLRNYVLTLIVLGAVAFGGGVWYSRINDNFHDFFTEYIPFGEQAVLYLEEMDFRKRFPNISNRAGGGRPRDTGAAVKIPAQSGMSWRVADSGEPASRQSSAVKEAQAAKAAAKSKDLEPAAAPKEQPKAPDPPKAPIAEPVPAPSKPVATSDPKPVVETPAFKPPEVDEPSRFPPASPIDPLAVEDAQEPLVQELVRMLNDIITVVNADKANVKYGATIGKAKDQLNKVGRKIREMKAAVEQDAAKQVEARIVDFDKAANDLITRVEAAMAKQEEGWRQEFGAEMKKIKDSYDERVKVMTERERRLNEERLNNRLLEQALDLKRQFAEEVKKRVEEERDSRLGKLNELSSAVSDLEKLTTGWNDVVDTNLRTQQLHVAVDAVRASLEDSTHPRPFIKELVALKEIASDDAVVDAAIASINPSAYQRGISTTAELIDRFRRVAGEVRKASLLPDDAGVASHASSWVLSKMLFKKQGHAAGDDVESILTRTQTYLEEGDLDAAAREMNGLTGWAKTLSRDWLGEVRKVLEVQQALEVIQTEARLQSLKLE